MSKNKFWGFIALLSAVLLILPGASLADETAQFNQGQASQSNITFGFRLTGGVFPLMRNDINDHLQGITDIFEYYSYYNPYYTLNSEFEMIKTGMDFSGEILISFMPNLSIGVGAGYLVAGKDTTMEVMDTIYSIENKHTYHPKFSVIPITLSLYYGIPVGNSMKVVLNAGLGYYLGTVNYDYSYEGNTDLYLDESTDTWSAKSNALGLHGGIDLEFGIARNLAFIVGAKGRYVKLTDLSGTGDYDYIRSDGYRYSYTGEDATLWYGNYQEGSEFYPQVIYSQNKPSSSSWFDVRKAEVNLSGIVFQAGIKVFF